MYDVHHSLSELDLENVTQAATHLFNLSLFFHFISAELRLLILVELLFTDKATSFKLYVKP